MPVWIGTSGWQYRDWRGSFYPADLSQARWLDHYAERFETVEVNNAFYRLPEAQTFANWRRRTPDGFMVVVKASRYLTHVKRLKDSAEAVTRLMDRARHLGDKLGPILLQLPPNLAADHESLDQTLACFGSGVRLTVEFRHASWFSAETERLLAARGAALCLADSPRRQTPVWRTAHWGYLRLHEGRAAPHPCYGAKALDSWAMRLAELWGPHDDVFVYFNNDAHACAVRDAIAFATAVRRVGLQATRVPARREVTVT